MKTPVPERKVLAATVLVALVFSARVVAHDELVINGGFEMGFGGWLGTYGYITAPDIALSGRNVGVITDITSSSVGQPMYQLISTTPGVTYTFKFSLLSGQGRAGESSPGNAPVNVYWDSQHLGVFSNPSISMWQSRQFEVTADSASTQISFVTWTDPHWQLIDNVSVVAVPEPASIVLLLTGSVAGVGVFRLRRR